MYPMYTRSWVAWHMFPFTQDLAAGTIGSLSSNFLTGLHGHDATYLCRYLFLHGETTVGPGLVYVSQTDRRDVSVV